MKFNAMASFTIYYALKVFITPSRAIGQDMASYDTTAHFFIKKFYLVIVGI